MHIFGGYIDYYRGGCHCYLCEIIIGYNQENKINVVECVSEHLTTL